MEMNEKLEMLEEVMDLDENELSADMKLADIEEWDSLSALSLIVMMKKEFGIELTNDTIRSFITVQDICDLMK